MRKPRDESKIKQKLRRFLLANPFIIYKTNNGKILTNDAAKVLVCCVYDIDDMFYYGYEYTTHFLDSYLEHQMNHVEIYSALQYLECLELIEGLSGNKDDYSFMPTHEGIHFFQLRRKNIIYLLANSVILPLIIAVATTLITLAINGAL